MDVKDKDCRLSPEKVKERLKQLEEMERIWYDNTDPVQMYLAGCIVTANRFANRDKGIA